jgi:hypothetical protein
LSASRAGLSAGSGRRPASARTIARAYCTFACMTVMTASTVTASSLWCQQS